MTALNVLESVLLNRNRSRIRRHVLEYGKTFRPPNHSEGERQIPKDNLQYDVPLPGELSNKIPVGARGSSMRERRMFKSRVAEFILPFEKMCKSILAFT